VGCDAAAEGAGDTVSAQIAEVSSLAADAQGCYPFRTYWENGHARCDVEGTHYFPWWRRADGTGFNTGRIAAVVSGAAVVVGAVVYVATRRRPGRLSGLGLRRRRR
jgi:hypothetical protein